MPRQAEQLTKFTGMQINRSKSDPLFVNHHRSKSDPLFVNVKTKISDSNPQIEFDIHIIHIINDIDNIQAICLLEIYIQKTEAKNSKRNDPGKVKKACNIISNKRITDKELRYPKIE
ncbi:993_t:CDS:2 [Diversispora eburnea]|uniref:993_t:CDS:1 n=1 Tax=Diversispora eburnea TaxID=1213867 RepID=A0A9N8Z5K9_9GLOM|nr:993_t:CDS:2 [Diversispora eburnea]